ncbi:unnamed protein product [Heterobilharzia americana]|nr:unnamed protein product [Heterobilharzia americana]
MGRMLKLDRLFTQRTIYMSSQKNPYYLNALQYFANEPSLNTLVTWLCFLIHWPFHAAWLGVFIDNYQKCEMNVRVNYLLNDNTSRSQPEGLNQTLNGVKVKQFGIEQLGPSLTVLYTRVLKRLGPLLQTVRLKALSSFSVGSATCPTSATIHSINEPFLTNELLTSTNKTLKVCELAFYDKDPAKLGEFLKLCDSTQSGSVSINQLLRLMKLTPFINPQISKWIKEVLLPKFNIVENNVEEKGRKTTSSRSSQRSQTFNVKVDQDIDPTHPVDTRKESLRSWILKMKESVPKKPLNQFTVDEVCQLVEKIVIFTSKYQVINVVKSCQNIKSQFQSTSNETDSTLNKPLSSEESETLINDPIPPAAVNTTVDHVLIHSNIKRYTDSIRKLNITGSVLDLCSLKDLEAKINMLPVDWKMFCAFIQHLKQTECKETVATKIPNSNEHFSLLHGQFPQNHQHQKITQTSRYKFNEIDKSSVISEVRKDQLMMNTVSDTSLTVKSAPLTKDYQFDNDLKLYDHSCNDKKDRISVTNNSRSMSMTGVNKLSDSKNNAESYTHVPYYNDTNELSKQKDYPQHHSKMTERLIDNIPIPCEKHQSMLDSNIISPQSRNMHYNDKIIKSQYELRSRPCPDSIHQISHQKLKHQKSLESRVTCDGNECDCYLHNSTFQDAMTVYRAYTLPHSLQLHQQKHHHQYMHDHAVHSPRLLNTTFCSRHRLYAGDSNLANAMTAEEEMLSDNLESSSHRCIQCKPAFHAEHHHHCPHQCISDQHIIRHFNVTTDYPPPYKKDSASTSLAGEIGDEVADMSQISADENDADDTSVLLDQKLEGRRLRQISVGATADTVIYSHQCDCSYWYANEQQPPHCQHNGHYNLKQSNDKHNENSGKIIHSDIQGEQINSSLDTLSTTTNSSSNNSSNTSISNDNASGHSQLDAINSADSCDQITSESSSDNTVNSK